MAKYYFPHDYGARNDPKMQHLLMELGYEGIGLYWCLIELMYEEGGYLLFEKIESIAYCLRTTPVLINNLISGYGLFKKKNNKFYSESLIQRLKKREEISTKRKTAIRKRWESENVSSDTNVLQEENFCKGNKNKIKEKENNNEIILQIFEKEDFIPIVEDWIEYKRERKEIYKSPRGFKAFCEKLKELSGGDPIKAQKIIKQSYANNWQGIFELKETKKEGDGWQMIS